MHSVSIVEAEYDSFLKNYFCGNCRGLGLLDYDTEAIVAFAFARGEGWEKYTVSNKMLKNCIPEHLSKLVLSKINELAGLFHEPKRPIPRISDCTSAFPLQNALTSACLMLSAASAFPSSQSNVL